MKKAVPYSKEVLKGNKGQRSFTGADAAQIAMPLGGLGAGCVCINGSGALQDFSIRGNQRISAVPDGHHYHDAAFATLHVKGDEPITRVVEGPVAEGKIYCFGLKGQGFRQGGQEGFPHFENSVFKGEFPFAEVSLSDPKVPLNVQITAFNPFIPLDDKNSSIPCAILEYTLENRSKKTVDYEFAFHVSHPLGGDQNGLNTVVPGFGAFLHSKGDPNAENFGSTCVGILGGKPIVKGMWFRGGWFDSLSVLWREISSGAFAPNNGSNDVDNAGNNGGSVMVKGLLKPKESITYPVIFTWYYPNRNLTIGLVEPKKCDCAGTACESTPAPKWRPYYASQWKDAKDTALYIKKNFSTLRAKTQAFRDALFASTLPSYVLDAVSANLAIMKSPTVLRLENGELWGFEGCFCEGGCCHGSCTHVWNYAQAFPHLFPKLERSLREQELERSMDERGHVSFRSAIPSGPTTHDFHAASDGQLGGIMKFYRDWQICGDQAWLKRLYPLVKKSLDYCIETWDPDHLGVLVEPHHNTYDIEFWGPDGMCSSFYLGALAAMAELARDADSPEDATFYEELASKGAKYLDEQLFNGEYFEQKVLYKELRNQSFVEMISNVNSQSSEVLRLLKKEGPKYQYGPGCVSDGVMGAWKSRIYGVKTSQNADHIRKNLRAIFEYNFRDDLWEHANPQRPGYALGHEPGLLLCSWPKGGKPTLPFPYSDEVWTGIEYQVASHLIEEGLVDEGLTIVKAARDRYNGRVRNPWNEYECGIYYARAMSSYAVLNSMAGFRYSRAKKTLWFGPKSSQKTFRCFFSTDSGYGTIEYSAKSITITMLEGKLEVKRLVLTLGAKTIEISCNATARVGSPAIIPFK